MTPRSRAWHRLWLFGCAVWLLAVSLYVWSNWPQLIGPLGVDNARTPEAAAVISRALQRRQAELLLRGLAGWAIPCVLMYGLGWGSQRLAGRRQRPAR